MFYISVGDYYMVMIRFTIVVCFDVYLPYHIFAQPRTALAVPWVHGPVESIYPPSPSCKLHWFRGMFTRNPYCIYYIYHECDKREREISIYLSLTIYLYVSIFSRKNICFPDVSSYFFPLKPLHWGRFGLPGCRGLQVMERIPRFSPYL